MEIFEVADKLGTSGEYILGADVTGSHACYLIYGRLAPGERGRELRPGKGHEELVLCLEGEMHLAGCYSGVLRQGKAIHLRGEESCTAENAGSGDVVYVVAGGHAGGGHEH
jgi:uncharacterized cupin superfamily protein